MCNYILSFFSILLATVVVGQPIHSLKNPEKPIFSIQPHIGYSISKTTFNIAGNERGTNPNILSELIWDPTNSLEYGVDFNVKHRKLFINGTIGLNNTLMGNVSDIDYDGDNRTAITEKSYLSNHKGAGYTFKFQPGYIWTNQQNLSFTTYLSVDFSSKQLFLLNNEDWKPSHPEYIEGLNSYYKYRFPSYGLGAQLEYNLTSNWSTQFNLEGYLSKYYAYGNWNLIDDFEKPISYEHRGNGKKIFSSAGINYHFTPSTSLGLNYHINHFQVTNGKDYLYTTDKSILKARLNDANETKHSLLLNFRYTINFNN